MDSEIESELHEFVTARYGRLRRAAYLLCGDWHRAEDLVQNALARTVVAARRRRIDNLDAYCRTVLLRAFLDDNERHWFRRERVRSVVPDVAIPPGDRTVALTLLQALRSLPPRQRAVVVLRYWEDRSVEETADALGVSIGTVKSHAARGLHAMREVLNRDLVRIDEG